MASVHLYSIAVCPFAQRTRILLTLKGAKFELTEIDITKPRPDWFLKLNPLGQVPVIEHQGRVLNESSVINEYLEEVFPEPRVFPADPYQRAISRILIDKVNNSFVPAMYTLLMNQDSARAGELHEKAIESWRWLNQILMRHNPDGTYMWDQFGMADLSIASFFQRYCLNVYYRGFKIPQGPEFQRVRTWYDALLAHPVVKQTGMSDEDFIKLYEDYSLGYGNGKVPPGRERSSFDLAVPLHQRPMPPRPSMP